MGEIVMTTALVSPHIELRSGASGVRPRIAGKGVLVQAIAVWHNVLQMSPEDIAGSYELSLAEVHSALAYYYDHREEMDKSIREEEEYVEEMKKQMPSLLKQKLRERFGL